MLLDSYSFRKIISSTKYIDHQNILVNKVPSAPKFPMLPRRPAGGDSCHNYVGLLSLLYCKGGRRWHQICWRFLGSATVPCFNPIALYSQLGQMGVHVGWLIYSGFRCDFRWGRIGDKKRRNV